MLMHIRTTVNDCERLDVGVGVYDDEVSTFIIRLLKACMREEVYLLVDDFDLGLVIASQYGYLEEAIQFYRMMFPSDLV